MEHQVPHYLIETLFLTRAKVTVMLHVDKKM